MCWFWVKKIVKYIYYGFMINKSRNELVYKWMQVWNKYWCTKILFSVFVIDVNSIFFEINIAKSILLVVKSVGEINRRRSLCKVKFEMLIYRAQTDFCLTSDMPAASSTGTVKHFDLFTLLTIVFSKIELHELINGLWLMALVHLKRPDPSRNIFKLWLPTLRYLKMLRTFSLFSFDLKFST